MSGTGTQVIHENDDDETEDQTAAAAPLAPVRTGPIHADAPPAADDEDFVVQEVDELGQPYADERLTEDSQGGTILDRQRQERGEDQHHGSTRAARRRAQQRKGKEYTLRENEQLKTRLAEMERRLQTVQGNVDQITPKLTQYEEDKVRDQARQIEERLSRTNQEFEAASRAYYQGMRGDADEDECLRLGTRRDELALLRLQLQGAKQNIDQFIQQRAAGAKAHPDTTASRDGGDTGQSRTRETRDAPARVDPDVARLADEFKSELPWYASPRTEQDQVDSDLLETLDARVFKMGLNPGTDEYWDKLDELARKHLPHRFPDENPNQTERTRTPANQRNVTQTGQRRGPPVATAEGGSQKPANVVRIDPGRKQALIDLGILDMSGTILNQAEYKRKLNSFAKFDRDNAQGRVGSA
jgi:hypothetical protein